MVPPPHPDPANEDAPGHGGLPAGDAALAADVEVPHASAADLDEAARLEEALVTERRADVAALLVATTLLRVGTVGAGLSVSFELSAHNTDARLIGLIGSINLLPELVLAPILARYADRFGRTRFLVGGPLVGAFGLLLLTAATLSNSHLQMAGARLFEGVAAAAFVPTALGTIAAATTHSLRARAQASGGFEGANLIGYALGLLFAGFVHNALHTRTFAVFALFYVVAAGICARWVPKVPPLPVSPLSVILKAVTGRGPIRTFLPAWMATFAVIGAFLVNTPALLRGDGSRVGAQTLLHRFSEQTVSGTLFVGLLILVAGIALWTPLLPRWGAARTMRRAAPGAWILCGGLLLINAAPPAATLPLLPIVILGIVALAGFGPAAVTYLAECSETFAADRSALMAFYTLTLAAGGLVGGVAGGFAARWAQVNGIAVLGLVLSIGAFIALGRVVRYEELLLRTMGGTSDADVAAPVG